jgi:L,D-transpeptidase catalytic domain
MKFKLIIAVLPLVWQAAFLFCGCNDGGRDLFSKLNPSTRNAQAGENESTGRLSAMSDWLRLLPGNDISCPASGRVDYAAEQTLPRIEKLFAAKGLTFPPGEVFIRGLKKERLLQLWARKNSRDKFVMIKKYPFCSSSGDLGPKRQEGDMQIPEGFYRVSYFNPSSSFCLSMRVNYPNASDRVFGVKGRLGGDIMIHGDCVTIGCIPITNDGIMELYTIAWKTRAKSGRAPEVHLFPFDMTETVEDTWLQLAGGDETIVEFWKTLKPGFEYFNAQKKLPRITVGADGRYNIGR